MEQGAQVRVAGPSRVLLALSTGALVAVTSGATAVVVLSGTAGVTPGQRLAPRPPVAAAPGQPPVVVLPPGALGTAGPGPVISSSRPSDGAGATSPRRPALSSLVLSLSPELSASVPVPAAGLLPPAPARTAPALALPGADAAVAGPVEGRGASKGRVVLIAPREDDVASDSLTVSRNLLVAPSGDDDKKRLDDDADKHADKHDKKAARDRREFAAQEHGRGLRPASAVPAVSPAGRTGSGKTVATGPARGTQASAGGERKKQQASAHGERKKQQASAGGARKKQKASGSSSGRRVPQGGRGSGRGPRS